MKQKAFAIFAGCIFIATLTAGAVGEQGPSQALSMSTCGTGDLEGVIAVYNFDSPTYKSAAEPLPEGVRSYLAQVLIGRLHTCAAQAGQASAACAPAPKETDPRALWRQLKFCTDVIGLQHPIKQQPLVAAQEPTFYVLLAVGAGPGGAPAGGAPAKGASASAPSGGKGGSGPASGSTATGSVVDSPSYFLLFLVAQRLERDVCLRSNISIHDCDVQHPVAVVPETTWNLEDFRTQCIDDPYVPNDPNNPYGSPGGPAPAGHGTLGAIALNGSTVTADGTFAIFTVYGSSEANYAAQVIDCRPGPTPPLSTVYSANISNGNKTTSLSFFPFALAGTLWAASAAAHVASLPAPGPSSSPNTLNTFVSYQTDVALGTFAANTSSLALGNPSSGLTFRHTFEAYANSLSNDLHAFCKLQPAQNVCKALKLPNL